MNVETYVGLSFRGLSAWPYLVHVSVMIFGFWMFLRSGIHLCKTVLGRRPEPVPWDGFLTLCTAISIAYLALVTAVELATRGEGGAMERDGRYFWQRNGSIIRQLSAAEHRRYQTDFLRAFSAGWLFFALAITTWNHNLLYRRRGAAVA